MGSSAIGCAGSGGADGRDVGVKKEESRRRGVVQTMMGNIGQINPGLETRVCEYALLDWEWNMVGNPVEPLGSVCEYLCGLFAVTFMWDTTFTFCRTEGP